MTITNRKYPGTSARCIPFPFARRPDVRAYIPDFIQPFLWLLFPKVALDDEMHPVPLEAFFHKQPDVVGGIIAGIQTEQERLVCNLPGKPQHFRKEGGRVFLAVLLPFAQLAGKKVSFRPDIRKDRSIPVHCSNILWPVAYTCLLCGQHR